MRREARYRTIKRTFLKKFPPHNPGGRVTGNRGDELFSKGCSYFSLAGEGFGGKCDGLIRRGFGTFATWGFEYAPQA